MTFIIEKLIASNDVLFNQIVRRISISVLLLDEASFDLSLKKSTVLLLKFKTLSETMVINSIFKQSDFRVAELLRMVS